MGATLFVARLLSSVQCEIGSGNVGDEGGGGGGDRAEESRENEKLTLGRKTENDVGDLGGVKKVI